MELIAGLIEGFITLIVGIITAFLGLFIEGAASLAGGDALGLLLVLFIEVIWWALLYIAELVISILKGRKPRKVKKPILWRPKKLNESRADNENT